MALYDDQYERLEQAGIPMALPREGNFQLVGQFYSVQRRSYDNQNKLYEENVRNMVNILNSNRPIFSSINGRGILSHLHTSGRVDDAQAVLRNFTKFTEAKNFYTFDIETLGDSMEKNKAFGVTEIAIKGYQKRGLERVATGHDFFQLIAPDVRLEGEIRRILSKLRADKYSFNSLTEWEKRTVIDLMRYSNLSSNGQAAEFIVKNGQLVDLRHNPVVQQVLDESENIVNSKVIANMTKYLNHMESGLNMLKKYGEKDLSKAVENYNNFLKANANAYFVSYNGEYFDLPTIKEWARRHNIPIVDPALHLDYLKAIRTIVPNPLDLHEELGRNIRTMPFRTSMGRLQEFRRTLGFNTMKAHSSLHDIGDEGLGGLIKYSVHALQNRVLEGYASNSPYFSWKDQTMKSGQTLFSIGGVQAYADGDLSFQAIFDEKTGTFQPISNSFNNTVINSKTFYRLDGLVDFSDDSTKRYGIQLYDPMENKYSFIIREGENAIDQLTGFLQSRFLNVDGLTEEERKQVYDYRLNDLARRRYLRAFSLGHAGTGKTGGFEAAKRLYENAAVLQRRIAGKHKNLDALATERAMEELNDRKVTSQEFEQVKRKHYRQLAAEIRITDEEMRELMDFKSLYNAEYTSEKDKWLYNPHEEKEFWKMKNRLLSEVDAYLPALQYIEEQFEEEMNQARGNSKLEAEVRKKRDLAWYLYTQQVKQFVGEGPTETPPENRWIEQLDNRRVTFTDYKDGTTHTINFFSPEDIEQGINRYVYQREIKESIEDPFVREARYRERINRMIKSMRADNVISRSLEQQLLELNVSSQSVYNTIKMIAAELQMHRLRFNEMNEMVSFSVNKAIQNLSDDINRRFMEAAVKEARSLTMVQFNPKQVTGNRIEFNPGLEDILNRLDETHLSGLNPNNRAALERVLADIQENNRFKGLHVALSYDENANTAKISIYRPEHSTSVIEHLIQGKSHNKAVEILMPLIGREGVHIIGNRRLNARSFAFLENGEVKLRSSAEIIAEHYSEVIGKILEDIHDGDIELANKRARRTLNQAVEQLAGIQRNMSYSDSYYYNRNQSDFFKQSQVDIQSAYIHDLYNRGIIAKDDFKNDVFDENGRLKRFVTFDDLTNKKSYEALVSIGDWIDNLKINGAPLPLFASSVKADHVAKGRFSMQDIRDYIPYGHYTFMGRDNPIQFMNVHLLDKEIKDGLENVSQSTNAYIRFDPLVTTDKQLAFENEWRNRYNSVDRMGVSLKAVFMNDQQLLDRIRELANDSKYHDMLFKAGIIEGFDIKSKEPILNKIAIPRIYEQQGLIAADIMDQLNVMEQKIFSEQFELLDGLDDGSEIKPGQLIGYETVNGQKREVRWESKHDAKLFVENGRVGAKWREQVFKVIAEGEKATDVTISRELLAAIVGDDSVSMVLNPNIKKHRDYGMWLSGKAKLLADHAQKVYQEVQMAFADKASKLGQRRFELQKEFETILKEASKVNLAWDEEHQVFIQRGTDPIPIARFNEIFKKLGIQDKTSLGYETVILETRASKVSNYGRAVDETGQQVLQVWHDEKGNLRKTYKVGRDGVNWAHREMRTLQELGLFKTYETVFETMMAQAQDADNYALYQTLHPGSRFQPKAISRLQEAQNYIAALTSLTYPEHEMVDQHQTLQLHQFRPLPELELDENMYRGTIFDRERVTSLLAEQGVEAPRHGYWLELPGVETNSGNEKFVTLNIDGERKAINRIFVPFMNLEGANGDIYLRELQQKIADIYQRAQEVDASKNVKERNEAFSRLQRSVDEYYQSLVGQITSSKGLFGDDIFKAAMPNSASGLFKLLDPETSKELEGEYTFISEADAKALGVYDKLMEIERLRKLGKQVDDLYVMNVRYPTFHKNAMQVSKLRIGKNVKQGEFLTTSLMSDWMKADSDGDYDHIVIVDNEEIQKEWKTLYEKRLQQLDQLYQKHMSAQSTAERRFDAEYITDGASEFKPFTPNTEEEIAAKIGKRAIGSASNLNLFLHQLADEYLEHGSQEMEDIKTFGAAIEQKLISSKHSEGRAMTGRAPAFEMIQAIYNGDWATAREIDQEFFGSDFQNKYKMNEAFAALDQITVNLKNGLYNESLRFGTSYGLNAKNMSVKQIVDMIHGQAGNREVTMANSLLNMIHKMMGIQAEKVYDDGSNVYRKVSPYESLETQMRKERGSGFSARAGEFVEDASGGILVELGEKVRETFEKISKNKGLKWGMIGGALALGGIAGYNILSYKEPLEPPMREPVSQEPVPAIQPPISNTPQQQNANITIKAKGTGHNTEQLSHMVYQGMQQANMNHGNARITMNHQDNTQKLNRFWYRDKIEENM
jgi:hypothetical protein